MKILLVMIGVAMATFFATAAEALKSDDFRIVDGKLYNTKLSTNWVWIPGDPKSEDSHSAEVREVTTNGVFFHTYWHKPVYVQRSAGQSGERVGTERLFQAEIFVKGFPGKDSLTTGQEVPHFRAMRAGVFKEGADSIKAYDFGSPNTPQNRAALKPVKAERFSVSRPRSE